MIDPGVPPIVTPEWLEAHLDRVRVVDVREPWEYGSIGHVPGAVNVPFETFREPGGPEGGHLPGAEAFSKLMGEAGVGPDDRVVAYDDEHGVFAARFVVTALLYGHDRAHLLDGDFTAWSRRFETAREPTAVEPTAYRATVPADRPLVDAAAVEAAAADPGAVLVDTRTPEEFAEGHIEGAVNLDWRAVIDPESRGLKRTNALLEVLADHGVTPERRIVLYCNTARRISHTYLVLRHLGFESVGFYEGSLTDWTERGLDLAAGSSA